ncbi:hypothetical protein Bca101_010587 [Brassica carinata]
MDNTDRRRRRKQHKVTLHDSEEVSSIEWEFINMTEQEEDLIFRMHRLVGDRWDLIAGRVPGRQPEEIERYWIMRNSDGFAEKRRQLHHSSSHKNTKPHRPLSRANRRALGVNISMVLPFAGSVIPTPLLDSVGGFFLNEGFYTSSSLRALGLSSSVGLGIHFACLSMFDLIVFNHNLGSLQASTFVSVNDLAMTVDQLPKFLLKEGTKTQVEKVNNTCRTSIRTSILVKVEKYIEAEYTEVLADPLFAQVMAIYENKLQYSGRVIHTFLCKQLLTAKRHELWFHYARRPLRFSMQEFYAITGLKYKDEPDLKIDDWKYDKGFWSKLLRKKKKKISLQQIRKVHLKSCNTWSHVDRLRLVYLCVIAGIVMAKDPKVGIPHKYIKLVMDFDKMRKYPWGLHSFDALVKSIIKCRARVKKNSYVIDGFSYALQIWLMEAIPDIGSLLGQKLQEGVCSMRCMNWKGSANISYEDIITMESNFGSNGVVFPYISSSGNFNVGSENEFHRASELKDERVDLIIEMLQNKYDWSKHVWAYQEAVKPSENSSEEDGSDEEEGGETSENEMEEEIEITPVSAARKRKNKFKDTGAESRKKNLLFQRTTEKYRDLEEEMKSYIQNMFKSSFTALALDIREIIDDRFAKLEEKVISSLTQGGAPPYTQSPAAAQASTQARGAPAYTQTRGADQSHTQSPAAPPASTEVPPFDSTRAPAPTPVSTHTSATAPTTSRSRATALYHTGGPATRSQTKDAELSDVFGSLFSSLDVNLETQEHLEKTMGHLTQESNRKSENHLFKWIDEALLDEIRAVDAKHEGFARGLATVEHELTHKMNEKVNLEIARVEHELTQKMNEKFNLEIASLKKEMQKKLQIATVAMVVVGAVAVIWSSLSV